MEKYRVKSKLYVTPKNSNYIFLIILNISLIVMSILSIVSMVLDGMTVKNCSMVIISVFVVIKSRKWLALEPYYKFSVAEVTLTDNIIIQYDNGKKVTIYLSTISSIEYSEQLSCLKFVTDYCVNDEGVRHIQEKYLFYVNKCENENLFNLIENFSGKKICFVDKDN